MAEWLLRRDAVHVLATDAHSLNSRPPILSAGRDVVASLCGQQVADFLVDGNPKAIVQGEPLPYLPPPKKA
jgi:protein-tyrosine phosphatase